MTYTKPDGTIELRYGVDNFPPGEKPWGMGVHQSTEWFRISEGPWMRLHLYRGFRDAKVLAEAADTCSEFVEAITPGDDFS